MVKRLEIEFGGREENKWCRVKMGLFNPHKNHRDAIPVLILTIILIVILVIVILRWRKHRGVDERSDASNERNRGRRSVNRKAARSKDRRWDGAWNDLFNDSRDDDDFSRHLTATQFLGEEAEQLSELRAWIGKGSGSLSRPYYVKADRYSVNAASNSSTSSSTRRSSSSSTSASTVSPVCPSSQPQNCPQCKDGGLGARCTVDTDCACGLKCQGRECICPKPPPPTLHIQRTGTSITVTFSPVPGADYYNVFLFDANGVAHAIQLFTNQTVLTFPDLPPGSFHVFAFSGSNQCGSLQQFSQSDIIVLLPCVTDMDCPNPTASHCLLGTCVQCLTPVDCPQGQTCNLLNNTCVPTCNLSTDCLTPDTICTNGQCVCPTPVITGMTISNMTGASWPLPMQFTFQGTGFSAAGANFSFTWRGVGSNGQVAATGTVTNTFLPLDRFPTVPTPVFPGNITCASYPCCNQFNFGCTASGCTSNPAPNVVLEFVNVRVTNACGNTSAPTCWRFTSLCPGGPVTATTFTCP